MGEAFLAIYPLLVRAHMHEPWTDAEREHAYDRDTSFGRLDKALDAAALNKWTVVDMKNDWKRIFAFQ